MVSNTQNIEIIYSNKYSSSCVNHEIFRTQLSLGIVLAEWFATTSDLVTSSCEFFRRRRIYRAQPSRKCLSSSVRVQLETRFVIFSPWRVPFSKGAPRARAPIVSESSESLLVAFTNVTSLTFLIIDINLIFFYSSLRHSVRSNRICALHLCKLPTLKLKLKLTSIKNISVSVLNIGLIVKHRWYDNVDRERATKYLAKNFLHILNKIREAHWKSLIDTSLFSSSALYHFITAPNWRESPSFQKGNQRYTTTTTTTATIMIKAYGIEQIFVCNTIEYFIYYIRGTIFSNVIDV